MGTWAHSDWRMAIIDLFHERGDEWRCRPLLGPIYQTESYRWRIADLAVVESVLDDVPLAVFEVLDPGEDYDDVVMGRLAVFETIGVPQVWMVDSGEGSFIRYLKGGGLAFKETRFCHEHIQFDLAEIAARVQHHKPFFTVKGDWALAKSLFDSERAFYNRRQAGNEQSFSFNIESMSGEEHQLLDGAGHS